MTKKGPPAVRRDLGGWEQGLPNTGQHPGSMKEGLPRGRRALVEDDPGPPSRRRDQVQTKVGPPTWRRDQVKAELGPPGRRRDHDMTAKGPPRARRDQRSTKEGLPAAREDRRPRRKGLPDARRALVGTKMGPPPVGQALGLDRVSLGSRKDTGMTASMRRVRAALHKPANASALVIYVHLILEKMTNNPWFPQPFPPLQKVEAAAKALHVAQTNVQTNTKGLANERNAARAKLSNLLEQLRVYVEGVANENPESAVSIIESAAMDAVVRSLPNLEPFRVTFDEKTRTARLACKAGPKGCTYYWQMSTDDGETWVDLPPTKQASTTVHDLVPGQTYWFRYRILRRDGLDDWSDKIYVVAR